MTVPVVLLTGFLGSGKTSLLNRLLAIREEQATTQARGKLAILVNELGAIGIDGSLLPDGATQQVELPGGCICCTLDENLEQSVGDLIERQPDLALIVIETTGIAEPLPILWTLSGEGLAQKIRVAAVVTVVDALEHARHRPLAPAVDNQVEHADILVISKLDTMTPERVEQRAQEVTALLRTTNPTAALVTETTPMDSARMLLSLLEDPVLDTVGAPRKPLEHHHHDHGDHPFESIGLPIDGPLDFEELTAELEALPASYVRIKGICQAKDESSGSDEVSWIAFHRVGARVSAEPLRPQASAYQPRVVALGSQLDAERLSSCIARAMLSLDS